MKILRSVLFATSLTLSITLFYGCSGTALQNSSDGNSAKVPPSQNRALQSISPSKTASDDHSGDRIMQNKTNEWIKNEWEPLTESNTNITKSSNSYSTDTEKTAVDDRNQTQNEDENGSSGLQHYVDKAGIYLENKTLRDANRTKEPSHTEKISTLPGIGKKIGQ
ncbi:MAG: hypothetical protein MUP09_09365 [Thiovulaceae bacterium]|nr:hypothetical protein [Sulfurimonadaceae bacterium]